MTRIYGAARRDEIDRSGVRVRWPGDRARWLAAHRRQRYNPTSVTKAPKTLEQVPEALRAALACAVDSKAVGPVLLDVSEVAGYTDWVLLLSGRSDRHVGGITEAIMRSLKDAGVRVIGTDGLQDHLWDLLDYDDFLIHVFYHPVRLHYDLEGMWTDAPRVELGLPEDVMDTAGLAQLTAPDPMPGFRGQEFAGYDDEFDDEFDGEDEGEDEGEDGDEDEDEDEDLEAAAPS